jgi:hypothetical protein
MWFNRGFATANREELSFCESLQTPTKVQSEAKRSKSLIEECPQDSYGEE